MRDWKAVSEAVRNHRLRRGLSQKEFAREVSETAERELGGSLVTQHHIRVAESEPGDLKSRLLIAILSTCGEPIPTVAERAPDARSGGAVGEKGGGREEIEMMRLYRAMPAPVRTSMRSLMRSLAADRPEPR